jgi:hypothetical protein
MISAELNEKLDAIEIHLDKAGIESLITQLESLKAYDTHIHLMTPSWGGKELSEAAHGSNRLINHLLFYSHQA